MVYFVDGNGRLLRVFSIGKGLTVIAVSTLEEGSATAVKLLANEKSFSDGQGTWPFVPVL